jgi:hypothetical protein
MATFNIYKHPEDDSLEVVKQGFSVSAVLMNMVLLGWVWAFNNRTPRLAWRLLALSAMSYLAFVFVRSEMILLFWTMFSLGLGGFANQQIEYSLKRRGYALLKCGVNAATHDLAVGFATKTFALG